MQAGPLTAVQPAASAPKGDALDPHAADQCAPPRARAPALCNLPSNSSGGQLPTSDSLADNKEKEPRLQGRKTRRQAKDMPQLWEVPS